MQNLSEVFQLLRWKHIQNYETYQSLKNKQKKKPPKKPPKHTNNNKKNQNHKTLNQNEKLYLPQILGWRVELLIQKSETS